MRFFFGLDDGVVSGPSILAADFANLADDVRRARDGGAGFVHVDALRDAFAIGEGRLTGGAVRSRRWSQMFADTLGLTVLITDSKESGALGTAMCAAVGTGMHDSLAEAAAASVRVTERLEPNADSHEQLEAKYAYYRRVIDALEDVWDASAASS